MLRANGRGGSSATVLAAHFAKRNTKFGGGAASFVGCFPEMRSDFVQGVEPHKKAEILSLLFLYDSP